MPRNPLEIQQSLFYAACLLQMAQPADNPLQLGLAWVFVAGRLAHSGVQVFTANVRLRGAVFAINFLAVLGMWLALLLARDVSGQ